MADNTAFSFPNQKITSLSGLMLQTLQLEVWGQQGLVPSVSLCTKSGGSAKGPAKSKKSICPYLIIVCISHRDACQN